MIVITIIACHGNLFKVKMTIMPSKSLLKSALLLIVLIFKKSSESKTSTDSSTINETENEGIIRLLTILPYPVPPNDSVSLRPFWDGGLAVLPAAQLAVEHVNQDPNTLPGYRVKLLNVDGGCDVYSRALMNFAERVLYGSSIAGIIGPGCTPSTLAISSILGRPKTALPNIHLATSPVLSNRSKYSNTYGIRSSSLMIIITAISLSEHNKWEKIAALLDLGIYSHLDPNFRKVVTRVLQTNRVVYFSVVYDTYIPFDSLMKNNARVILLFTTSPLFATKLLCIAHIKGMVFPYYQWVVADHHLDELLRETVFHYDGVFYNCSKRAILNNNLLIVHRIRNLDVNSQLVSGHTYSNIYQNYLQKLSTFNKNGVHELKPDVQAAITYDAVWALALAINTTLDDSTNVSSIRYGNKAFTDKIKQSLAKIAFDGASGHINFDSRSGYINRIVDILHINSSMNDNLVGFFNGSGISITNHDTQIFINTTTLYRTETVHPSVATIFLLIILFLSAATLILHIVSTIKRQHPSIKASSPVLNHFIFTGCYIWTAASIIYIMVLKALSLENYYANCCQVVFTWLLPVGWTMIFGTLIAKTWRIYKIFVHFHDPGNLISNRALVSFILLQLGLDIALGIPWSLLSPAQLQKTDISTMSKTNPQKFMIVTYLTQRSCVFLDNRISYLFWIVTVFGYKILQVVVLLTLTLLTKKIVNLRFSTLSLRKATYLSFILSLSLLPPFIILWNVDAEIHIDFILFCTFISGTISICVMFVLLPPILPVFKK